MDPLSQLKDIHLPEQINNYPIAYGWWILLAIIVVLLFWIIKLTLNKRIKSKSKKLAIAKLTTTELNDADIIKLLKWTALQYFPRQHIAKLHGDKLVEFLSQQLPEKHREQFSQKITPAFNNQYQLTPKEQQSTDVKTAALLWLNHALPPKDVLIVNGVVVTSTMKNDIVSSGSQS